MEFLFFILVVGIAISIKQINEYDEELNLGLVNF